jgi:hypothetical protein
LACLGYFFGGGNTATQWGVKGLILRINTDQLLKPGNITKHILQVEDKMKTLKSILLTTIIVAVMVTSVYAASVPSGYICGMKLHINKSEIKMAAKVSLRHDENFYIAVGETGKLWTTKWTKKMYKLSTNLGTGFYVKVSRKKASLAFFAKHGMKCVSFTNNQHSGSVSQKVIIYTGSGGSRGGSKGSGVKGSGVSSAVKKSIVNNTSNITNNTNNINKIKLGISITNKKVNERFTGIEERVTTVEDGFAQYKLEVEQQLTTVNARIEKEIGDVYKSIKTVNDSVNAVDAKATSNSGKIGLITLLSILAILLAIAALAMPFILAARARRAGEGGEPEGGEPEGGEPEAGDA